MLLLEIELFYFLQIKKSEFPTILVFLTLDTQRPYRQESLGSQFIYVGLVLI